jgi:hypothetical protein
MPEISSVSSEEEQAAMQDRESGPRSPSAAMGGRVGNQARTAPNPGFGVVVAGVGGLLWIIALCLNAVKVDGMSASHLNGVCQSDLGQLGQAVSGAFGYSTPSQWCSQAATVEAWKGILFWGGLALLCGAGSMIWRKMGWSKPNRRVTR